MPKIVFIGGGSAKFIREVSVDLFSFEEFRSAHITLMDIDRARVELSRRLMEKIIHDHKLEATVESTLDQREALDGADYVVITFMVGGYEHYHSDVAIPAKYGVGQAVSDTIGPGGVFRIIRTAPVLKRIAEDLSQVAPDAWVLNYANPMAMNTWTLHACGHHRSVGLCHSLQNTAQMIAGWLDVPEDEVDYTAGGINHVNFYLTFSHRGRDLYPGLRDCADRIIGDNPSERVRFELLEYLGYWPAEGAGHQSEYYPWFRKDEKTIEHYGIKTFDAYEFDLAYYHERTKEVEEQLAGTRPISYERSNEYCAYILHSLMTGRERCFHGNVPNRGLITNLPPQAVVEVPCLVDRNGISPCRVGAIPPQLAAVMRPHIAVHELAVAGALQKDRRRIYHAVQADPLTGAILTLPKIREMVDELFEANRDYAPDW